MAGVLNLVSSTPYNNSTEVYRDIPIVVQFDRALAPGSITAANINLYLMPNYQAQIAVGRALDQIDNTKLVVTPSQDLPASSDFALVLMGDNNITDAVINGISSTDSRTLSGNQVIRFKTGNLRQVDVNTTTTINTGGVNTAPIGYPTGQNVNVVEVDPKDGSNLKGPLTEITVRFDRPIYINNPSGSLIITTERLDLPLEEAAPAPVIVSANYSNNMASWTLSGDTYFNVVYTFTLDKDYIHPTDKNSMDMVNDYIWSVTSPLTPMLSTPYLVRMRGGFMVKGLSDDIINRYIFQESVNALTSLSWGMDQVQSPVQKALMNLVTCSTVYAVGKAITLGALQGVGSKVLADLSISYDAYRSDRPFDELQNCIDEAYRQLGVDRGARLGVKSADATDRTYMAGRRTIFKAGLWVFRGGRWARLTSL